MSPLLKWAVAELDEKIVVVNHQIEVERQKEAIRKGASTGEVAIVLGADAEMHVNLKLTYIVSNASWESTYELHAATDNSKPSSSVALHYRARIVQSTGENWTDTALTLSTVDASTIAKSIPWLNPIKIRPQSNSTGPAMNPFRQQLQSQLQLLQQQPLFQQPQQHWQLLQQQQQQPQQQQQQPQQSHQQHQVMRSLPAASEARAVDENEDFEDIAIPGALSGPTTIVTETPLAISYAVEGATTVPSDGTVHQVTVAVLPFEAKISHICTPRVDPRVYLQCHVKNTSEYRLLPGPVSVVLNDGFVSTTSINEINTGDTFTCTLGDDVATKVTYARSSKTVRSHGGSFQEVFNTTTYNTKITIHNKHPFSLTDLVVREIIPTSDDKRAKVLLRKPEGLADAKDGQVVKLTPPGLKVMWGKTADGRSGEKDGRFEWVWSVDGGAKVALEAQWELKAPTDIAWVESVPVFSSLLL
ncbi:hypothetical protein B0H19DRAFT_1218221 [Mycena capillaripes]|nr:hypothetical protein B0H19DRAFT_1218221 [Mycena capillaripes]